MWKIVLKGGRGCLGQEFHPKQAAEKYREGRNDLFAIFIDLEIALIGLIGKNYRIYKESKQLIKL